MNTVVVGLDNGSKDYLGRREPIKKQGDDPLAKAIAAKWSRLQVVRQKTEALRWEACAYVQHRMNEFNTGNSPIKPVKLYNTAGILAFDTFINGYHGNLISPSMRWFKLTFTGENFKDSDTVYGANDYLEVCENQMYAELNRSNFYPTDKLATKDAVVQGTSAEWVYDDVEIGISVFETIAPWDFWIDKNTSGRIDTIFIRFTMTAADDWAKQLRVYWLILQKAGFEVKGVRNTIFLKDWSKTQARRDASYPQKPIVNIDYDFGPVFRSDVAADMMADLSSKIQEILEFKDVPEEEMPNCSNEERWERDECWAIMKKGRKTAVKRHSKLFDAEQHLTTLDANHYIEHRPGVPVKCLDYCVCAEKCSFYKKYVDQLSVGGDKGAINE